MKKLYFKKTVLALGVAAFATGAFAQEGSWQQINILKNPAFIPGWNGALAATADGVGEVWSGAFELYQIVENAPAGQYTLTANAFYRCGSNDYSMENMKDGANHNAYIFLGDAKTVVAGLFDNGETLPGEGENFDPSKHSPNGLGEANIAFEAGKYVNTVTFNHPGGNLRLGIANTGGRQDEWTAFDNFKLTGPDGEIALVNGDFSEGLNVDKNQEIWDCANIEMQYKSPDANKNGGIYRKTNASAYNFGQQIELPAGKYRFGVQSFLRYGGAGNAEGKYVTCKGAWGWVEDESPLDRFNNGNEQESHNAYIYVTDGFDLADDNVTPIKPVDKDGAQYGNKDAFYKQTAIKSLYAENLETYPDNEPVTEDVNEDGYGWCDSGFEYQAAACFINNPDLYRNYVEFELTEPTKVWVGLKKDVNAPTQYWNPFRDFTIEKYVDGDNTGVNDIISDDENAPVEYFNLQGVRVANPENGVFIVKQGKKVSKVVLR